MTREEAIKHLKLMQSGARNAIRFKKNDKEISKAEHFKYCNHCGLKMEG